MWDHKHPCDCPAGLGADEAQVRDRFEQRQLIVSEIRDLDLEVEVDADFELPPTSSIIKVEGA